MNREFYFDLCTYAFLQLWDKKYRSSEKSGEIRDQIIKLSKKDRFLLLDLAAEKWVRNKKLKNKKDLS